ncbi:TPA: DUF4145 domain-containing protein [Klebsiella pneumoniae]|uniref:DUF4145 domain-containing protein n=1 Tax=Klebsiella TaxID=570 RepID=UPI001651DE5D|nr:MULTISPECIES: DUF4145 domain-containing protein [Klebsiella]MBM7270990.1 DUF4145 domain-containing protein [Klebsiella pneumoniae]HCJ2570305.1 DUF4145 domain-containing protein [Klebsiella pneumoniae]HCJ2571071.1 DUF4145 domain-containing protein [Klebsiella pneumoniae]HCJ3375057.1 DUF4145 domain-containing protein [Klebsiella pneumoniae]HCJ3375538.1 DUF4145 domain-containing protein [Klebsiella pneumoniae]
MPFLHYFSDVHCAVCGHNSSFSLLHAACMRKSELNTQSQTRMWREDPFNFRGLFTCGNCFSPVTFDFSPRNRDTDSRPIRFLNRLSLEMIDTSSRTTQPRRVGYEVKLDDVGIDLRKFFTLDAFYPEGTDSVPEHLPAEIHSMYVDDLLQATSSPRLTLVSCRMILESACRDKLGTDKGKLVNLIQKLGEAEALPRVMLDWANTIRQFGNEAVHVSGSPTVDEATEVRSFTVTLLEFLYSHPARIDSLRKGAEGH